MAGDTQTVKVTVDGKEIEVPIPDGWLSPEQIAEGFMKKDTFTSEMDRRIQAAKKGLIKPEDLLKDEEFLKKVLEAQGKELFDPEKSKGKGKQLDDEALAARLAEELEVWRKKELDPVRTQLTERETTITGLRDRILDGQIVQAAINMGVKPAFLKPPSEGAQPPIVAMLRNTFGLNDDHDEFFVVKGDGWEFSSKPDDGLPYKTVSEFMRDWAGKKENGDFVDANAQTGPGLGRPGDGGVGSRTGKDVVLTREQAGDHATYTKAVEQAQKQGGRVITPQPSDNPLAG